MDKDSAIKRLNRKYSQIYKKQGKWELSERFVPGEGPTDAKVMLIGQAPGKNEDIQRRPFIGTSGKFLDRLINIAGLERKSVYICSVVQYFPPDNRMPTDNEIDLCKRYLFEQIKIINPKIIVLLGSLACRTVLGMDNVWKNHGKVVKKGGKTYLISIHPAAAIRIRTKMPAMEQDFLKFRKIIETS